MIRVLLILCAISGASLEMQFQHQMYISRKSRSNSNPTQTGYIYRKITNGPGIKSFDNAIGKTTQKGVQNDEDFGRKNGSLILNKIDCQHLELMQNEDYYEYVKAKTNCLPAVDKESVINSLKSTMRQEPASNTVKEMYSSYDGNKEFRIDDEDVRTDSRNPYNGWPYSYGPYEYQMKAIASERDKAKDKRFLFGADSIIPVHETVDEYPNNLARPFTSSPYHKEVTTDNPIYGNQPFFSFVLNDYFNKNREEDSLNFKDFTWDEEFDYGMPYQDVDDNGPRGRRLDYNYFPMKQQEITNDSGKKYNSKLVDDASRIQKAYNSNEEYGKHDKIGEKKDHQASDQGYKGHHKSGFKDFIDSFANKFGSENNNKNSKFMLKHSQDKGEKRKGFRRVYHKDEYQEDNEFFDNTNKNAQGEETGDTNFNVGGSQAFLQSHATASVGNEADSLIKRGTSDNKMYESNNDSNKHRKGYDSNIKQYRDIARNAVLSNNADYSDY